MKKLYTLVILFSFSLLFTPFTSNAQDKEKAEKLVNEGVAYHDKGDYEGALKKYDKALTLDKDNLMALAEKGMTLLALDKYEESAACCQLALDKHSGDKDLKSVYVTYGNALDALKKTDKSIEIYEEGIKQFPDYYQLHFNKGITLSSVKSYDEALLCFQKSAKLNPRHPGTHNALARILNANKKRIPSLLAYCRFFVLEPQSDRAKVNLESLQTLMNVGIEKTGKKSITINVTSDMLSDTLEDGSRKENSFSSTDLLLSMDAGLDFDKKNKKDTEVEKFIRKFETVCSSLKETKKDNFGFYWDYYVPYFVEMKEKGFIETFAYITFATSSDETVAKWLKAHKSEIDKFYDWSGEYDWTIK
ncbi:MAG: tetratricopeptide repeat protein [Bacteroidota bacterium]